MAIASTPVTAEQPAANALSSSTIPTASVAWIGSLVPITRHRMRMERPRRSAARTMLTRNTAVGGIRNFADSVIPNMFIAVRITSPIRQTGSRWCDSDGNTLARLAAPAARLTATVRT